jgi:hypothetical protein
MVRQGYACLGWAVSACLDPASQCTARRRAVWRGSQGLGAASQCTARRRAVWRGSQGLGAAVLRQVAHVLAGLSGFRIASQCAIRQRPFRRCVVGQSGCGSVCSVKACCRSAVRASSDPALLGSACARFVTARCGWAVVSRHRYVRSVRARHVGAVQVRRVSAGSDFAGQCPAGHDSRGQAGHGWLRSCLVWQSWFGSVPLVLVGHARSRRGSAVASRYRQSW